MHRISIPLHEAWLFTDPSDVEYLSGFVSLAPNEREGYLLATSDGYLLVQSSFSPSISDTYIEVVYGASPHSMAQRVTEYLYRKQITQLCVDFNSLTVTEHRAIESAGRHISIASMNRALLWSSRMRKQEDEVARLRKASSIVGEALDTVIRNLRLGMTELDVRSALVQESSRLGADDMAFPTIVCFGSNGALPHHQPTNRELKHETPVLIDCGVKFHGYRSDITRCLWWGSNPTPEYLRVKHVVDTAYQRACDLLEKRTNQTTTAQVDAAARDYITEQGYGSWFIHSTGHGVGIDIHEPPSLSRSDATTIEVGMCLTVEPGIYLTDAFGYRYENTILITPDGYEELTLWT